MSCPQVSKSPAPIDLQYGRERGKERFHLLGEKRERRKFHGGRGRTADRTEFAPFILARCPPPSFKHIPETAAKLGTNIGMILKGLEQTSRTFFHFGLSDMQQHFNGPNLIQGT